MSYKLTIAAKVVDEQTDQVIPNHDYNLEVTNMSKAHVDDFVKDFEKFGEKQRKDAVQQHKHDPKNIKEKRK